MRDARRSSRAEVSDFARWQSRTIDAHHAWARANVPFFRDTKTFPVLTREMVREHVDALRAPGDARAMASGGSTGEPVVVYQDPDYFTWAFAQGEFIYERCGLRPWAMRARVWGEDPLVEKGGVRDRLLPTPMLNAFEMDEENMDRFAALLQRKPPETIVGYASALELFARFLLRAKRWTVRPRAAVSTAESLSREQRTSIEEAFGCRAYDIYGSRECAYMVWECPAGGHHVSADGRKLEIVDEHDREVGPGVPGRVLVTDFRNHGFGLIRYENGDVASWAEDRHRCACGCVFPRIERLHGRTSDFITLRNGERVHGEWFTHLFYGQPRVARFQVRQPTLDALEVLTVGGAGEPELTMILEQIRARMGPGVSVTWRRVDEIPLTRAGKRRFTISEVPFR